MKTTTFPNQVKLFIPLKDNEGNNNQALDFCFLDAIEEANRVSGGCTTYQNASGMWVEDGRLFEDSIRIVEVYTSDVYLTDQINAFEVIIKRMLDDDMGAGKQLAVSLCINGKLTIYECD